MSEKWHTMGCLEKVRLGASRCSIKMLEPQGSRVYHLPLPQPVTRDVTGSHGYVTRTRFFFLFPISPLFPSRDLGPTVPLHGPALYHMT